MKKEEAIIQGLARIGSRKVYTFPGIVKSVNLEKLTCTVQYDDVLIENVRLTASTEQPVAQTVYIPKQESWVLVSNIETSQTDAVVVAFTEIDKVILNILQLNCNANEIQFNSGENGGLIKIEELKTQLNYEVARIDAIINAINTAATATGTPDSGALFKTNLMAAVNAIANKANYENIENPKIKH